MKLENFPQFFEKIFQYQISWKPMRTDGRMDGKTDMTKLIVAFRNFADAPNSNYSHIQSIYSHKFRLSTAILRENLHILQNQIQISHSSYSSSLIIS